MKPYSIFLPQYDYTSGGIKVMYGLYGALLLKGQIVVPNAKFGDDFIAIYPEIVNGNPFGAKHVVRYVLNEPGVMAGNGVPGPTEFDEDDLIYVFSELFNKKLKVPDFRKLFLPVIDTNTFKDHGKERTKTAYFVGKGVDKGLHPKDAIKIDRSLATNQDELANVLNECQVMYQYDPVSAMSEIARLCGCKVRLFQDKYTKSQYRDYEPGINGISFKEGEDVPLAVDGFRSHYHFMKVDFYKKLDDFIKRTQAL